MGTFPKTFTVVLSSPTGNATLGEPSELEITITQAAVYSSIFAPIAEFIAAFILLVPGIVKLIVYGGILAIIVALAGGLFTLIATIKNRF
jgi:hypothetical protein